MPRSKAAAHNARQHRSADETHPAAIVSEYYSSYSYSYSYFYSYSYSYSYTYPYSYSYC